MEYTNAQEDLHKTSENNRSSKTGRQGRSSTRAEVARTHVRQSGIGTFPKTQVSPSNVFSDYDEWSGVVIPQQYLRPSGPSVPSLGEESSRRRGHNPLKSALKRDNSGLTSSISSGTEQHTLIFDIPLVQPPFPGPTVQSRPLRLEGSKSQQRILLSKKANGWSPYNRVAQGQLSKAGPGNTSTRRQAIEEHHFPPAPQPNIFDLQVSPIITAPRRNAKKRSASSFLEEGESGQPSKLPRLSLLPHGLKATTVIPDSQEFQSLY